MLFHSYENNNNSLFNYEELFKDLLNFNNKRLQIVEHLFKTLSKRRDITISDLKTMFEADKHPFHLLDNVNVNVIKEDYMNFVNSFESIYKVK
jgi:hypothetical protein